MASCYLYSESSEGLSPARWVVGGGTLIKIAQQGHPAEVLQPLFLSLETGGALKLTD